MGYLFLAIALIGGSITDYCGKYVSNAMKSEKDPFIFNCFRMILCLIIGFCIAYASCGNAIFCAGKTVILLGAMSGVFSALFVVMWLLTVKSGAYATTNTFIMGGTLVPMLGSALIFDEKIKLTQIIGFIIVIAGMLVISSYNNSIKSKITPLQLIFLLTVSLSSGLSDFSQKLFADLCTETDTSVFNFYTYVFAAIFLFAILLFKKGKSENAVQRIKSVFVYIAIMAAALFANSYFKVEAAHLLDAAKLYPLNQGASLLLGIVMAAVFFREKVTLKCVTGVFLGFVGICMINLS